MRGHTNTHSDGDDDGVTVGAALRAAQLTAPPDPLPPMHAVLAAAREATHAEGQSASWVRRCDREPKTNRSFD
jgi:hypothetical protein